MFACLERLIGQGALILAANDDRHRVDVLIGQHLLVLGVHHTPALRPSVARAGSGKATKRLQIAVTR